MLQNRTPLRFVDRDFEESGNPANLAGQVSLQVGEVDEKDVGKVANGPPSPHAFPEGPVRISIAIKPFAPVLTYIGCCGLEGRPHESGRIVHQFKELTGMAPVMIVETPNHVPSIASNVNVASLWRNNESICWEVRLDETAVSLGCEKTQLRRNRRPHVQPGGLRQGVALQIPSKDELTDNLLHPCSSGLGICRDDDIAVAKREIIPDPRIQMVIL